MCTLDLWGLQWLPESPRFHVLSGKPEKAYETLKRIALDNKTAMPIGKLVCGQKVRQPGILRDLPAILLVRHGQVVLFSKKV